jgi:hypothetical protein
MQDRNVLSIDTDSKWFEKFKNYQDETHDLRLIKPDDLVEFTDPLFDDYYSIAFIDGAPAEIRQPVLERIKADYYIVHDTECVVQKKMNCYMFNFSMFKHVHHFKTVPPMTSLLSNLNKINNNLLSIF